MISGKLNLIMSGAYISGELVAEFGMLPPSFLPVGVGRLYDLQIDLFKAIMNEDEDLYLIVPESFDIPSYDVQHLKEKNAKILSIPDGVNLGEAIIYALNMLTHCDSKVRLLHGDTFLSDLPNNFNIAATHRESDDYSWAMVEYNEKKQINNFRTVEATLSEDINFPVLCGFFSFLSSVQLIRSLIKSKYDFIQALNNYNKNIPMATQNIKDWYDFGHLQTYFHSRRMVTTARSFNSLKITKQIVRKSSKDHFKMQAEANWLSTIPAMIKPYAVSIFDYGFMEDKEKTFYITDYQYAPNLAELFVFSKIGRSTWKKILNSCASFLKICAKNIKNKPRDEYMQALIGDKTKERLERYAKEAYFDIYHPLIFKDKKLPSLNEISEICQSYVTKDATKRATIMHGDFCFSNILYNARKAQISLIDPRGYVFSNKQEIYGDIRYDIAKLTHSIHGLYDLIIAKRYDLKHPNLYEFDIKFEPSSMREWLNKEFSKVQFGGISPISKEIRAMTILLFISMLPLHNDDEQRQAAFIGNVLRLFTEMEEL